MGIQHHAAVTVYYILSVLFLWNTILKGEAFAMTPTPLSSDEGVSAIGSMMTTGTAGTAGGPGPPDSSSRADSGESSDTIPRLLPAGDNDKDIPVLKLGETISFEALGPIILNTDGTTRRISNWDDMTEQEQQTTWRRIKQRNEQRRQHLLQLQQQQVEEASQQQQQEEEQEKGLDNPGNNNNNNAVEL
jgi:predicted Fe-S protein YdhL (DUF1289 family)